MNNSIVLQALAQLVGVAPISEYRFHATRKWRFDYAWPEQKVALEIEGGVWTGGRHVRPKGYLRDIEKYNAAAVAGWRILRCTPTGVLNGEMVRAIREAINKTEN
jgi:very-short-patch-repair endonuclease